MHTMVGAGGHSSPSTTSEEPSGKAGCRRGRGSVDMVRAIQGMKTVLSNSSNEDVHERIKRNESNKFGTAGLPISETHTKN